jgi:hypothetical protein
VRTEILVGALTAADATERTKERSASATAAVGQLLRRLPPAALDDFVGSVLSDTAIVDALSSVATVRSDPQAETAGAQVTDGSDSGVQVTRSGGSGSSRVSVATRCMALATAAARLTAAVAAASLPAWTSVARRSLPQLVQLAEVHVAFAASSSASPPAECTAATHASLLMLVELLGAGEAASDSTIAVASSPPSSPCEVVGQTVERALAVLRTASEASLEDPAAAALALRGLRALASFPPVAQPLSLDSREALVVHLHTLVCQRVAAVAGEATERASVPAAATDALVAMATHGGVDVVMRFALQPLLDAAVWTTDNWTTTSNEAALAALGELSISCAPVRTVTMRTLCHLAADAAASNTASSTLPALLCALRDSVLPASLEAANNHTRGVDRQEDEEDSAAEHLVRTLLEPSAGTAGSAAVAAEVVVQATQRCGAAAQRRLAIKAFELLAEAGDACAPGVCVSAFLCAVDLAALPPRSTTASQEELPRVSDVLRRLLVAASTVGGDQAMATAAASAAAAILNKWKDSAEGTTTAENDGRPTLAQLLRVALDEVLLSRKMVSGAAEARVVEADTVPRLKVLGAVSRALVMRGEPRGLECVGAALAALQSLPVMTDVVMADAGGHGESESSAAEGALAAVARAAAAAIAAPMAERLKGSCALSDVKWTKRVLYKQRYLVQHVPMLAEAAVTAAAEGLARPALYLALAAIVRDAPRTAVWQDPHTLLGLLVQVQHPLAAPHLSAYVLCRLVKRA